MKHLLSCAALGLSLFAARPAQASHIMGAELTYKWLGGMDYEMTLVAVRDCYGIWLNSGVSIAASSSLCGLNASFVLPERDTVEVAVGCTSWPTTCNGGTYPGAELHFYRDTVTLPAGCADWVFSWASCCRNAAIDNIVDADQADIYIEAWLDNANVPGNSSPIFQELPGSFICLNAPFCLPNGGYDPDGDSLVYTMVTPEEVGAVPIVYMPGFTATDPFPSSTGHVFDPVTGNHCSTPSQLGAYVVAYAVDEYRNGTWVGRSRRDIQLWVVACTMPMLDVMGVVNDTTGTPVTAGTVELYQYGLNSAGSLLVGNTPVGPGGDFAFSSLPLQQYLVRAVPDTVLYPGTATSYHESTYYWTYADVISSTCDTDMVANIGLVPVGNLAGTGYLSGFLGDLGIVRSDGPGAPWEGVGIVLEHWPGAGLAAYTRTDMDGHYHFANVADGTYRIVCDHPGLPMLSCYTVTVGAGTVIIDLNYGADPAGFYITGVVTNVPDQEAATAVLMPNPVHQGFAIIKGLHNGQVRATIIDAAGRVVFSAALNVAGGALQLPTDNLPAGSYTIVLDGHGQHFRMVKEQ
ncbi:MAG: carboxypeptidase regulatory-like domain-containing protein [Flavobacteriales bacterium]|nr:MAG: carboxypeptidase regulatory-like domain-containing protein [Flavobacteriales bacterium]